MGRYPTHVTPLLSPFPNIDYGRISLVHVLSPGTEECSDAMCIENVKCVLDDGDVAVEDENDCGCPCNDGFQCSEDGFTCEGNTPIIATFYKLLCRGFGLLSILCEHNIFFIGIKKRRFKNQTQILMSVSLVTTTLLVSRTKCVPTPTEVSGVVAYRNLRTSVDLRLAVS